MAFRTTPDGAHFRLTPATGDELTAAQELIVQAIEADTYFISNEEPTGAVDSSNVTFTLANTPDPAGSLQIYINRMLMIQGKDYSVSGATITFDEAPSTGSIIRAFYLNDPN